ncbi:MAG: carbohydrate ABC transporter permease [Haloechinothrix sp.]
MKVTSATSPTRGGTSAAPRRLPRLSGRTLILVGLGVYALFVAFPLYWAVNTSFKEPSEVLSQPPTFLPEEPTTSGYSWFVGGGTALPALLDSLTVTFLATIAAVALGTLAGYAFSRYPRQVGGGRLAFWLLSTRIFPPIATALPLFFLYDTLNLLDSHFGLALAYFIFNVPLATWLMRTFFDDVPRSFEEAAYLDGYGRFATFRKVVLPLVQPGLVATTILVALFSWNEFLFALVLGGANVQTVPVLIPQLASGFETQWNQIAVLSLAAMIPPVLAVIFFRDRLTRGMSLGVVKRR